MVPQSYKKAIEWYANASESSLPLLQHPNGFDSFAHPQYEIALAHEMGWGTNIDAARAEDLYRTIVSHPAATAANPLRSPYLGKALNRLGKLVEGSGEGSREEAIALYKKASIFGSVSAEAKLRYFRASSEATSQDQVRLIQEGLRRIGYRIGDANGIFTQRTYDGIRAFQHSQSSEVSGWPSDELLSAINRVRSQKLREAPSSRDREETLQQCIRDLNAPCVEACLVAGANPNVRTPLGDPISLLVSPLNHLFKEEHEREALLRVAQVLFDYGTTVSTDSFAFFWAIEEGNLDLLKLLLENGASPDVKHEGKSPMELAAYYRRPRIAALLERYGAPPLRESARVQEELLGAFSYGVFGQSGIAIANSALKRGASVNGSTSDGSTALVNSVSWPIMTLGSLRGVQYLIDNGADVNLRGAGRMKGVSGIPLHLFIAVNATRLSASSPQSEREEIQRELAIDALRALLDAGAKIASQDDQGRTPLHVAAERDNYIAAAVLMASGARPAQRDRTGRSPVDYAESAEMIALLEGRGDMQAIEDLIPQPPSVGSGVRIVEGEDSHTSTHVVTNAHVVEGCSKVIVYGSEFDPLDADVVAVDAANDLALLRHAARSREAGFLDQASTLFEDYWYGPQFPGFRREPVRIGEDVVVAGYPYGDLVSSSVKVTSGVVSAIRGPGDDTSQFQIDAAVQPGSSGGPVYDDRGNLVGIVVSGIDKSRFVVSTGSLPENINFAIKGSTVEVFLKSLGREIPASSWTSDRTPSQIGEIASRQAVMVRCAP